MGRIRARMPQDRCSGVMRVESLSEHPGCYRVTNERSMVYWVNLNGDGPVCDCPAACWSDHPCPCRHVRAVLALKRNGTPKLKR